MQKTLVWRIVNTGIATLDISISWATEVQVLSSVHFSFHSQVYVEVSFIMTDKCFVYLESKLCIVVYSVRCLIRCFMLWLCWFHICDASFLDLSRYFPKDFYCRLFVCYTFVSCLEVLSSVTLTLHPLYSTIQYCTVHCIGYGEQSETIMVPFSAVP